MTGKKNSMKLWRITKRMINLKNKPKNQISESQGIIVVESVDLLLRGGNHQKKRRMMKT
jgi:hypothetical protein